MVYGKQSPAIEVNRYNYRKQMSESANSESFEEIVQWAYSTLPERIRELPDFPGIQVVDEPPKDVFREVAKRKKWVTGTEMLGLYSGVYRTERQHFQTRIAPDLIFVFRGPILRCSKGNLRAEVKRVVWHEVAHWLGNDEEAVKELGLSTSSDAFDDASHDVRGPAPGIAERTSSSELVEQIEQTTDQERCIHCYSADITCKDMERPLSYSFDPATMRVRRYTCRSCGFKWQDDDGG